MARSTKKLGEFGDFFQEVMSNLVTRHSWDDPYGAMSPQFDAKDSVRFLNVIHARYLDGSDSGVAAEEIARINSE